MLACILHTSGLLLDVYKLIAYYIQYIHIYYTLATLNELLE